MVADGIGDRFGLALFQRIVAAHDTLQLRELANHLGHEVRLGEARRPLGQFRISADFRGQFPRQCRHALHLVAQRAKLRLERNRGQFRGHLFQRRRLVLFPEEAAIIETRRQDTRIAFGQLLAAICRFDIRNHDEIRRELAGLLVVDGEVFLVRAHGQLDHFRRQAQEGWIHVAQHDNRPFGETNHFFQKSLILDPLEASVSANLLNTGQDHFAAGITRQLHMASTGQGFLIVLAIKYLVRSAAVHAVAFGFVAAGHAVDLERHNLSIQNADNPLQRAHPTQLTCPPAHALGPVEAANDGRHGLGDDVCRIPARRLDHGHIEVALFRV